MNSAVDEVWASGARRRGAKATVASCDKHGVQSVRLRAHDGRALSWKPDDGTDALGFIMFTGRAPR